MTVRRLLTVVDRVSLGVTYIAMVLLLGLVAIVVGEIFSRYVLGSPNMWTLDMSFMLNGSIILLAAGFTLQQGGHIRIDFLLELLPRRGQHIVNLVFFGLFFLPMFGLVTQALAERAIRAYMLGHRELSSAWGPIIWPYLSALTLGAVILWLQALAETVRYAIGVIWPERVDPLPKPDETPVSVSRTTPGRATFPPAV